MLLQLNIQNFAIVRSLDIDWQQGMTTITGETGAGKSIAIDGLGLCLGERATSNTVRPNAKKAELAATFDIKNNSFAQKWLIKNDLHIDDECILRRVISAEGRSKAYINGSQVPLAQLKEIGHLLINIHGQHDHQLIVKATEQRRLLDNYADHPSLLEDVKYQQQQCRKLTIEFEQLQESKQQREAKRQLLQYQVTELDEFSLQEGEFETLENDYKRHSNAQDILNETLQTLQLLSEDEQSNVVDNLRRSCENLSSLSNLDTKLSPITETLNEALLQIEDVSNDLRQYYDQLDLDPETYAAIESRYSQAVQLSKKHHVTPENMVLLHNELTKELNDISSDESRLNSLLEEIEHSKQAYFEAAQRLSTSRQAAAKKLNKQISKSMQALNMPNGEFKVLIEQPLYDKSAADKSTADKSTDGKSTANTLPNSHTDYSTLNNAISIHGIDDVNFLVSINPGQPLEAMNKVASGGELSRISLAMQVILADKVVTPTLIFDEVDVGISGPTAAMVGAKLQELAKNTQVICVTHLPQVASKGHQQLFVAKLTDGEHTETTITELCEGSRVKEIARLLAGDVVTEHSLANAQELLAS